MKYLILLLVFCVGCGGSGGGPHQQAEHWVGTWGAVPNTNLVPPPGESGTLDLQISANGTVTGTCFNAGKNETASISGTLTESEISLIFDYPVSLDWTGRKWSAPNGALTFLPSSISGNIIIEGDEYPDPHTRTLHGSTMKVNLHPVP